MYHPHVVLISKLKKKNEASGGLPSMETYYHPTVGWECIQCAREQQHTLSHSHPWTSSTQRKGWHWPSVYYSLLSDAFCYCLGNLLNYLELCTQWPASVPLAHPCWSAGFLLQLCPPGPILFSPPVRSDVLSAYSCLLLGHLPIQAWHSRAFLLCLMASCKESRPWHTQPQSSLPLSSLPALAAEDPAGSCSRSLELRQKWKLILWGQTQLASWRVLVIHLQIIDIICFGFFFSSVFVLENSTPFKIRTELTF